VYVVLLPAEESLTAPSLVHLAVAIACQQGGHVVLLGVVVVPADQPLSEGMQETRSLRATLDTIHSFDNARAPVRTTVMVAHDLTDGIRRAVEAEQANLVLLSWQAEQSPSERLFGSPIDALLCQPPCDVIVVRVYEGAPWQQLLLPVCGGPHMQLACNVALALAAQHKAAISLLYTVNPHLPDDGSVREQLHALSALPQVTHVLEHSLPPEQAILVEAPKYQAVVLGVTGRLAYPDAPIDSLADRILRHANTTVVLVRHCMAAQLEEPTQPAWRQRHNLSSTVDNWFAENTFTSAEYEDIKRLVARKEQQGVKISLALPTLNEEATIGDILEQVLEHLVQRDALLDEVVLIDSNSTDRTREIAAAYGVPIYVHQEILPQYGAFYGKGEALWKSLYVLHGDIIAWCDTDIKNFHPRFVYGVVGPLLRERRLMYSKGFYRRPIRLGDPTKASGGGRVTELVARPLLNMFYPELSGMLQPLSGEYAGRRAALEAVPFFTGYGVEIGILIDLLEQYGLSALAQVDLLERMHRNRELVPLSKMAFAIMQVVIQRMEQQQRVSMSNAVNQTMKLISEWPDGSYHLELREIRDHERPPMIQIREYRQMRGLPAEGDEVEA
jgi:glucosyl-3-phosphoglycerate synthase